MVPISPELLPLLMKAAKSKPCPTTAVVSHLGMLAKDLHRPTLKIIEDAGVALYAKPFHTLRRNREQDWMDTGIPFHVVIDWMGHSDTVAKKYYLRVDEHHMEVASKTKLK